MQGSETDDDTGDLCRRCSEGDEDAFREAYRRFAGALYGAAWRILKSSQEAEEVVQEAFLTLYRKGGESRPENLGGWLHRVAVNRSLDRIRSRSRRSEVELDERLHAASAAPSLAAGVGAAASRLATGAGAAASRRPVPATSGLGLDIERAVARLPERTRMVFLLHDIEGFTHREIAEIMGISDGSSKSMLFRARALLREWLEPGGDP